MRKVDKDNPSLPEICDEKQITTSGGKNDHGQDEREERSLRRKEIIQNKRKKETASCIIDSGSDCSKIGATD